jgi:hypothetical protein
MVPAFHRPYRSLANGWSRAAQTSPSTVRSVNLDLSFAWLSTTLYLKPLDLAQTPFPHYETDKAEDPSQKPFSHGGANDVTAPPPPSGRSAESG